MFFHHFRIPTWTKNGPKMGPQIDPNPLVEIIIAKKIYHATPLFASKIDPGAQADFWTDLGRLLVALGSLLALFGSLLVSLGSLLAPFGALWLPFGCIFVPFCNLFATMPLFGATFAPFCTIPNFRMSNIFKNLVFFGTPSRNAHAIDLFSPFAGFQNHFWTKSKFVRKLSARTRR
jgi:hypothetical protein